MGKFKRVCVYCGSNSGNRKIFSDAALDLGREMVVSLLLCFLSSLIIIHTKVQQWFFEIGNIPCLKGKKTKKITKMDHPRSWKACDLW